MYFIRVYDILTRDKVLLEVCKNLFCKLHSISSPTDILMFQIKTVTKNPKKDKGKMGITKVIHIINKEGQQQQIKYHSGWNIEYYVKFNGDELQHIVLHMIIFISAFQTIIFSFLIQLLSNLNIVGCTLNSRKIARKINRCQN